MLKTKTQRDFLFVDSSMSLLDGVIDDYLLSEILRVYHVPVDVVYKPFYAFRKVRRSYVKHKAEMYSGLVVYASGGIQKELPFVDEIYCCKRCKHRFYRCGVDNGVLCCPCCRSDKIKLYVT